MSCIKARRQFTEAAREAAALARQRKRERRELYPEEHELVMMVVRASDPPTGFGWQIRRFGHVGPVAQSECAFENPIDAGRSGQDALDVMRVQAARRHP